MRQTNIPPGITPWGIADRAELLGRRRRLRTVKPSPAKLKEGFQASLQPNLGLDGAPPLRHIHRASSAALAALIHSTAAGVTPRSVPCFGAQFP